MEQYEKLYQKLVEYTITPSELEILNDLAFGKSFMDSDDKGSKVKY